MTSLLGESRINALGMVALSVLTEGPRHPYDLYQVLIQRREDVIVKLRPGTLYHAIARLAEGGFVAATGTDRDGNRPERTTYEITTSGRQVLRALIGHRLANPQNEYPIFPATLAHARRLPAGEVAQHLEYRRSVLERDVEALREAHARLQTEGKPPAVLIDLDYLITVKDGEISWLTTTIEALRSGDMEWTTA